MLSTQFSAQLHPCPFPYTARFNFPDEREEEMAVIEAATGRKYTSYWCAGTGSSTWLGLPAAPRTS